MSPVRVMSLRVMSASLLALALCANAAATEVLPLETAAQDCPPAPSEVQVNETAVADNAGEIPSSGLEAEPGLPAGSTQPTRNSNSGGDDSSAPARSSRWNAFLPGMVR